VCTIGQKIDAAAQFAALKCDRLANRLRDPSFPAKSITAWILCVARITFRLLAVPPIRFDLKTRRRAARHTICPSEIVQGNHSMAPRRATPRAMLPMYPAPRSQEYSTKILRYGGNRTENFEYQPNPIVPGEGPSPAGSNVDERKRRNTDEASPTTEVAGAKQQGLNTPKAKRPNRSFLLLCGAFTYKLCASNVFPVRKVPAVLCPLAGFVKLICRCDYPSPFVSRIHPHRVIAFATQRMA